MGIIRTKKDKNFSVVSNIPLKDEGLSWKAKGILMYLLSKPDDWETYIEELKKRSSDKRHATMTGVRELVEAGYIERDQNRKKDGTFGGYDYTVRETAFKPNEAGSKKSDCGSSDDGSSDIGKPDTTKYGDNQVLNKPNTETKDRDITREDFPPGFQKKTEEEINNLAKEKNFRPFDHLILEAWYQKWLNHLREVNKHLSLSAEEMQRLELISIVEERTLTFALELLKQSINANARNFIDEPKITNENSKTDRRNGRGSGDSGLPSQQEGGVDADLTGFG